MAKARNTTGNLLGADIKLLGDRKLLKKFNRLAEKDQKKIYRKGLRAGAKEVLPHAKAATPVDTGQLQKAVKVKAMKRSKKSLGARVTMGEQAFVGKTFYGGFLEYGAPKRGIEARRFLKKAADQHGKKAGRVAVDIIKKEILKVAKK